MMISSKSYLNYGLVLFLFLASCSSGNLNRTNLEQQIGIKSPVITDQEIAKALTLKPNLPKPFTLAVYFQNPKNPKWLWTNDEVKSVITKLNEYRDPKQVKEIKFISPATVQGRDLKSIRLAAARHQSDAVLVFTGAGGVQTTPNTLGKITYPLLLTFLFMPGLESKGLFLSHATLWDVKNEFLYYSSVTEGQYQEKFITVYSDGNPRFIEQSRKEATDKLLGKLKSYFSKTSALQAKASKK